MKMKFRKQARGFTIIEVMIVLAIAGLILAIVLLAVPALQRSQRNDARSSDATHLAGLVSDWVSNHGGTLPTQGACSGTAVSNFSIGTENFSQLTGCTVVNQATTGASGSTAIVDTNASCNSTTVTLSNQTGSFAVAWQPETTGTAYTTCIPG